MRVLITGSAGFVGSHFTAAYADHHLTLVDVAGARPTDARDFFRRDDRRYDLVIHCAAVVGGRRTIEGEPLAVAVDLSIDAELFAWAVRTRPRRVVYFSSSAAYPIDLQTRGCHRPLRESDIHLDAIRTPDLTYGWAKLSGEMLAGHARAAGVPVTVVRPFSGYGEAQAPDYPFRAFVDRARRRADPFDVWGDGSQTRDFVHVDDVVATVRALVDAELDGPVNIGTGRATSFDDLAAMVCAAAGYSPAIRHVGDAPVGVHWRVADMTRLADVHQLGVTLEEGIERGLRAHAWAA